MYKFPIKNQSGHRDLTGWDKVFQEFYGEVNRHDMSHSAASSNWDIVRFVFLHHDELVRDLEENHDGVLPAYCTIRRQIDKELPQMKFDYAYKKLQTDEICTVTDQDFIKRKKEGEEKLYEIGAIDVREIRKFHDKLHHIEADSEEAQQTRHAILSNDGVQEVKSNSRSLNVFTLQFRDCKVVYPIAIIRPEPCYKAEVDSKPLLFRIIEQIQ